MFYFIGIVLTFFLSVLLITKKNKTISDRILIIWLLAIGLHLFLIYLTYTDKIYQYPHLLGLHFPMPLLHGPFLFLYTGAVTHQQTNFRYHLVHFIPFLLVYCLFLPYYLQPTVQKILVYKNEGQGYETQMMIMLIAIMISGVVYVISSHRLLSRHKKKIRDQFSSADQIHLLWLHYLIFGIGVIWLFVFFGSDVMIFNSVVIFVFFIGYFGIKQVGIFSHQNPPLPHTTLPDTPESSEVPVSRSLFEINKSTDEPRQAKYERSSLTESAARSIHKNLVNLMLEDKMYTNPEITLGQLAKVLDIHPNNLSQVINTYEGKTFFDYINHQRIDEFKRIFALPESNRFTFLAVAHHCGFNSKTSFNRNFKNATGLSPSEYLRETQINLQNQ